jgi:CubicO group peptidase (beta-lactamase class C family)
MAEQGLLRYEDAIASHWPEFGAHGKGSATVGDAVTHRAGVPSLPEGATYEKQGDWSWMTERLAAAVPAHEPGKKNAYHSRTYGYVLGEIVQRADPKGRTFDQFLREEVQDPLGIDEVWHRFPASLDHRVALVSGPMATSYRPDLVIDEESERNTPDYWHLVNPSGAMMTARGGARLFALYAHGGELDGTRLLPRDRVRWFLTPRPDAFVPDITVGRVRAIGTGGLWLGGEVHGREDIVGFGKNVLWHPGGGGTVGFADLDLDLAVMICNNRLYDWEGLSLGQHPFAPIVRAIYREYGH